MAIIIVIIIAFITKHNIIEMYKNIHIILFTRRKRLALAEVHYVTYSNPSGGQDLRYTYNVYRWEKIYQKLQIDFDWIFRIKTFLWEKRTTGKINNRRHVFNTVVLQKRIDIMRTHTSIINIHASVSLYTPHSRARAKYIVRLLRIYLNTYI